MPRENSRHSAQDVRDWGLLQPAIGRCTFCPEWAVEGTAEEVRDAARAHRRQEHPELEHLKKRRSKTALMRWRSVLDEDATAEVADVRDRRMKLLGIPIPEREEGP
jgi:hypothetical protein